MLSLRKRRGVSERGHLIIIFRAIPLVVESSVDSRFHARPPHPG